MTLWLVFIAIAYLVGSIPFGLLIGLSRGVDIRTAGSGNVGATNLGRLLGKRFGVACFLLDAAKGLVPVLFFPALVSGEPGPWLRVALAASRPDSCRSFPSGFLALELGPTRGCAPRNGRVHDPGHERGLSSPGYGLLLFLDREDAAPTQ